MESESDASGWFPSERVVNVEDLPCEGSTSNGKGRGGGVLGRLYFKFRGWRGNRAGHDTRLDLQEIGGLRRFRLKELSRATDGFSLKWCTGNGYSSVYKGILKNGSEEEVLAIKRLPPGLNASEIEILGRLRHPNVVKLLGWCHEDDRSFLVYEYFHSRSLDHYLSGGHLPPLPWRVRYWQVTIGLASALLYLQEGLEEYVVQHGDINASNILLDEEFNPKLAVFPVYASGDVETNIFGTVGYLDPEYVIDGTVSKESDIYAFGVVCLQLATGRRAVCHYAEGEHYQLVRSLHETREMREWIDPVLEGAFDVEEMVRLLLVGLWCTMEDPRSRPSASGVLRVLNVQALEPYIPLRTSERMGRRILSDLSDDDQTVHEVEPEPELNAEDEANALILVQDEAGQKEPEPAVNADEKKADEDSVHTNEVDASRLVRGEAGEEEPEPELISSQTTFDIGIPPDYSRSGSASRPCREDHQHSLLNGSVKSLHKILQPQDRPPRFDEVLKSIRICTAFLVMAVGPPLDDWNDLAQSVLRALKEKEDFVKPCADPEPSTATSSATTMSSLRAEMDRCALALQVDDAELGNAEERLARARQECDLLVAKLKEAQDICLSIEEEMNIIEQRRAQNLARLEQKGRQHTIFERFESVLHRLSSFRSDM